MLASVHLNRVVQAGKNLPDDRLASQIVLDGCHIIVDNRSLTDDGEPRKPTWKLMIELPRRWMERQSWSVLRPVWCAGRLVRIEDEQGRRIPFRLVRKAVPAPVQFGPCHAG